MEELVCMKWRHFSIDLLVLEEERQMEGQFGQCWKQKKVFKQSKNGTQLNYFIIQRKVLALIMVRKFKKF